MKLFKIVAMIFVLLTSYSFSGIQAEEGPKILEELAAQTVKELLLQEKLTKINVKDLVEVKEALWKKYKNEQRADTSRSKEFKEKKMNFNGSTMNYEYAVKGEKPKNGRSLYIALHGGGGAPVKLNDGQYDHMKVYYKDSVKEGVYVATRAVSNTWDLHFRPDSYVLYDRLIENMILFEDVDPNRVYVMGFSAGGDGVYRISTKMSDRWAAASMSAGHPGGIKAKNLYQVPFLLQVGIKDAAYKRNEEAAKFDAQLEELEKKYSDGFIHQTYIHLGRGHNFLDNHPKEPMQKVLTSPKKWLATKDKSSEMVNTNAIAWLKAHTRKAQPKHVLWDVANRCDRSGSAKDKSQLWATQNRGLCHYWLRLSAEAVKTTGEVDAAFDKETNTITINKMGDSLSLLVNQDMCDLSKPVKIIFTDGGQTLTVKPRLTLNNLVQTLFDRGDANYMFEAVIDLKKNEKGKWVASS